MKIFRNRKSLDNFDVEKAKKKIEKLEAKIYNDKTFCDIFALTTDFCMRAWKVDTYKMAEIVDKYNLATFVKENEFDLNGLGPMGMVESVERHIRWCGGNMTHEE